FSKKKDDTGRVDYAEIRVFSPEDGAQPETRWLPLLGLTYDPKDDLLDVAVEGLDHLVGHPEAIYVDEAHGRLDRFEVVRRDGTREVIAIRCRGPRAPSAPAFGLGMHEDLRLIAAGLLAGRLSFGAGRARRPRGLTAAGGLTAAEPAAPTRRSPQAT